MAADPGRLAGMTVGRVGRCGASITGLSVVLALALAGCTQAPQPVAAPQSVASTATASQPSAVPSPSAVSPSVSARVSVSTAKPKPSVAKPSVVSPSVPAKPSLANTAPAGLLALPVAGYTGTSTQAVTVIASSSGDTQARLQAWNRIAGRWIRYGPEVTAWLGSAGLTSNAREGFSGTPIGSFTLTHTFGNYTDPGTRLPYFQAGPDDWWSGDASSRTYNTHQRCAASDCPFNTEQSENLHDAGSVYGYAVVIDYNTAPVVAGKGSAFFLHISQDQPTEGCVSISQDELVRIMRWLDPSRRPRIIMGLG